MINHVLEKKTFPGKGRMTYSRDNTMQFNQGCSFDTPTMYLSIYMPKEMEILIHQYLLPQVTSHFNSEEWIYYTFGLDWIHNFEQRFKLHGH